MNSALRDILHVLRSQYFSSRGKEEDDAHLPLSIAREVLLAMCFFLFVTHIKRRGITALDQRPETTSSLSSFYVELNIAYVAVS